MAVLSDNVTMVTDFLLLWLQVFYRLLIFRSLILSIGLTEASFAQTMVTVETLQGISRVLVTMDGPGHSVKQTCLNALRLHA